MRKWWIWVASASASLAACSFAWDDFDPRLAGSGGQAAVAGGGGTGGAGGGASSTTASGSGGATTTSSSSGSGGMGGQADPFDFLDDFNRPDNAALGNGWIEKDPPAFEIRNDELYKANSSEVYRNQLIYRPPAEEILDVEVSVEVVINQFQSNFPQLFVRGTGVAMNNYYDAYGLYLHQPTEAYLVRQEGGTFGTDLDVIALSPNLQVGERYRLTLSAVGAGPVQVEARIELDQGGGNWMTIGSSSQTDSDSAAFTAPGTVGISGSLDQPRYTFDNFRRTAL